MQLNGSSNGTMYVCSITDSTAEHIKTTSLKERIKITIVNKRIHIENCLQMIETVYNPTLFYLDQVASVLVSAIL